MQLRKVITQKDSEEFIQLPHEIYKNDKNWIAPLKQDIQKIFDPKKNKYFRHGEAVRWILSKNGKTIGRVAAFINRKTAEKFKQPTGGMGFFECINDKDAAFLLFDTCKEWLEKREMQAMDGPINFGEKDQFWGLITENFNYPPYYNQNYNPAYYVNFFEDYGFKLYYEQYIYFRTVEKELSDKLKKRSQIFEEDPAYEFTHIKKSNLEKYAEDFRTVYNRAWVKHEGFGKMEKPQALAILNSIKPILDEKLVYFAYFEGRPIGFFIALPEINQIFKYVNGNLNWWGKIKFLYHQMIGSCTTFFGLAFGIDPDFQGKGLEAALFEKSRNENERRKKYKDVVITWIGDFNPKMLRVIEGIGAEKMRTLVTYRYLFDKNASFERAKAIH